MFRNSINTILIVFENKANTETTSSSLTIVGKIIIVEKYFKKLSQLNKKFGAYLRRTNLNSTLYTNNFF